MGQTTVLTALLRWRALAAAAMFALCGAAAGAAGEPVWFEAGRPGPLALQAVQRLADAGSHGLDPRDYDVDALRQAVTRALQGPPPDAAATELLDQALTAAMQRYLTHLHRGRVDPSEVHHHFAPPRRDEFDAAAALRAALAVRRLELAEEVAVPPVPLYASLRESLARHRALQDHPAWRRPLPPLPSSPRSAPGRPGKLESGQPWSGLGLLAQRLAALGDLPAMASGYDAMDAVHDAALVSAVQSFQQRHGLTVDGNVGPVTLKQLQVTPAARVRQIELTLERLRWTPLLHGPRMIVINIPEFVLRAYEVEGGRVRVRQTMKVIVGKSFGARTPLFDEDLRFVEFSPYWNVPPSIARKELVPRLRRDPGHFERQGYEFVAPGGRVDATVSGAALDAVLAGGLRIRQRPGPMNALGEVKFVFPNRDNIYLHHTPAPQLFERERRDFSHGCIRVEEPEALAGFVLQGMPEWDAARIRRAMAAGTSSTVRVNEPVRVLIAYGTALVNEGRTHFFEDIYGHDRRLDDALRRRATTGLHTTPSSPP